MKYYYFGSADPLNSRRIEACTHVKNIFTNKKYDNIEITHGGPSDAKQKNTLFF